MSVDRFYPSLNTLISSDAVPNEIGFFKNGLSNLFGHFFYRDLQVHKTVAGDAAFYSLKLVTYKRLVLEVPGTGGLALILNPSLDDDSQGAHSEFPISLNYKWGILRYAKAFDLQSFDWSGSAFFNLILDLTGVTKQQLLTEALAVFTDDPDPIQEFIDLFNNNPSYNPVAPLEIHSFPTEEEVIADVLTQLITNGNDFDAYKIILELYIVSVVVSLGSLGDAFDKIDLLFARWLGTLSIDNIKELLTPQLAASIDSLSVGVQFPSTILREVDADGKPIPDPQNPGSDKPALLSFDVASLKFSTASGLEFDLADSLNISFPRSEILKSGLILDLHEVKVDFSRTTNIPEAIADGRPADFVGVYVKDGTIGFPAFWNHDPYDPNDPDHPNSTGEIKARNLLIGTGGLSGTLSLEKKSGVTTDALIECKFGKDFSVSLNTFSMTLKLNAIKETTIKGTLTIPGFKTAAANPAKIDIDVAIRQDGDFDITAKAVGGVKISCGEVFDITLKSAFFGKKDDDFYLGVSGSIKFTAQLLKDIDPIEVEKLLIWSDGRFEIEGGTLPLPKNIRFPIGPAELSISAIHMGSHQQDESGVLRKYRYFGFDGGVDINPGGVDVRGKGIKFYFTVDGGPFRSYLEIKSLAIDLVIPGNASKETATLLVSGFLNVEGTSTDPSYEGGVTFSLPKAKIAGGAAMKYQPKKPAFLVDAFVELSTPIPLGATSLGIYGFNGLFGQRYVATKKDTETWFDYYKGPPSEGVSVSKFKTPDETRDFDNPFSIGAGVSIATTDDSGKKFSCKLFLLLSLPDLIYLEGKANILGPRVGLEPGEDPPFSAVLAISSQSVEMAAGVSYKLPREDPHKGWILDLNAEMRAAFFFHNSSAWYINFGTIETPNTALVLSLFHASTYLMISASGIAAGASVTFGFEKSYAGGLVHASVGVYIKVGGFISFVRPQIGGFAMLGGHVDVRLMKFSFYLSIDTSLSVEAPKPFFIQGSVHLCVGIKIFKKQIKKCFDVEFKWEKDPAVDRTPVLPFADVTKPNVLPPISGTNMLSGESFKVAFLGTSLPSAGAPEFDETVLPLDTWVDLEFLKGLLPGSNVDARIGRLSGQAPPNTIDYVPPAQVPHKVAHQYSINAVEIKAWNGNAWVDYRPYEAMSPPDALAALGANPSAYKDGFWQNTGSGFNKIRLLAETSFSYMQQGQPGWYVPEQFGMTGAALFCRGKLREQHCIHWIQIAAGTIYPDGSWQQIETVLYRVAGGPGTVIDWNSHVGIARSLVFSNEATAQIVFNEPCVEVNLKLTTFSSRVVVRFYRRDTVGARFVFTLAESRSLTQLQLLAAVRYNNPAVPVVKVEIDPIKADPAAIYALQVKLDDLYRQLYEGNLDPDGRKELEEKIRQLEEELSESAARGCTNRIDKRTLLAQLPIIRKQLDECIKQLNALQAAQQHACKNSGDFSALFARCFPQAPSRLSYEIVERFHAAGRIDFQFKIYDDLRDAVLFNGTQAFADRPAAVRAVFDSLELAYWPGDYALMAPKNEKHFYQLIDSSSRFTAVNPSFFPRWDQLLISWEQTVATVRAARSGGTFIVGRREGGRLICDEEFAHLDCWNQLSAFGGATPPDCQTIVAGIVAARAVYCGEYNKLYRALYDCNKQLLDEAIRHCEELTHAVDVQLKTCQALSDQLAAIQQLINFIDANGPLSPPADFPCSTLLHEACCLLLEDYQFNVSVPDEAAIKQDYADAVQGIEKMLTPVWRPNTRYALHLQVSDTVDGTPQPDPSDFYFGFRTAGPVGHFHTDPEVHYVAAGKPADQYMLTSLKGYIDYRRSYPNADGELIRAKPLFYEDARILLFFTKRYVYHFFNDWPAYNGLPVQTGNAIQIIIKDPAEDISFLNPTPPLVTTTEIPQAAVSWPADQSPRIPEDIRTLLHLRNPKLLNPDFTALECWPTGGDMIKPASVCTKVTPQHLKPLKLYTAVVNNLHSGEKKEVHRYVFQTSRYPDFVTQVRSYRLDDGNGHRRDAIFRIDIPLLPADINLMYDVVTGNPSAPNAVLAVTWADPFDRLVEEVMKLKPLDPAISTEFNIVRNSITNAVLGLWIRNPEPFNDPKIPDDVLARSLCVLDPANVDFSYKVLFSKDGSQAFVMHPSRMIPVTPMKLRFAYLEWDGSAYVERAVVISDAIDTQV